MIARGVRKKWKKRPKHSHKGDFGRAFILAGSQGYTGAAHLAAMGALRIGAGLVTLGVPQRVYSVLARREAEVMVRPFASNVKGAFSSKATQPILKFLKTQDVFAIGPGVSQETSAQKVVRALLSKSDLPCVVDADGLNALKGHLSVLKKCANRAVMTPHPGEFRRLFGGKLSDDASVRRKRALEVAKKYELVVVLKGHRTVVADPQGHLYVNRTGNPGMASGGTGDVLTGIILGLLAQRFSLWDAACLGVYLHGAAGDRAARKVGEISLVAGDILEFLPATISSVSK